MPREEEETPPKPVAAGDYPVNRPLACAERA